MHGAVAAVNAVGAQHERFVLRRRMDQPVIAFIHDAQYGKSLFNQQVNQCILRRPPGRR